MKSGHFQIQYGHSINLMQPLVMTVLNELSDKIIKSSAVKIDVQIFYNKAFCIYPGNWSMAISFLKKFY